MRKPGVEKSARLAIISPKQHIVFALIQRMRLCGNAFFAFGKFLKIRRNIYVNCVIFPLLTLFCQFFLTINPMIKDGDYSGGFYPAGR